VNNSGRTLPLYRFPAEYPSGQTSTSAVGLQVGLPRHRLPEADPEVGCRPGGLPHKR
jgi:hypothetical protein